ncbi:MAG: enoyl-CoA hydratase/isomerase family protein [Pigmentiphaga sp.]|uniref:enoyl-CoA hydratase/isomerase family protein n=1 Tax=Pigmentiphaga sp. TaxID=1977564 RepID=UPI0029B2EB78|nr:enoyl-CoA hydratase/isomerase family protein [Pigmentiphaga sp.]MDX3907636.1 enoyl-CoA hydratase/isomerase family protein [Pigmentiphaga sp.]
MSNELLVQQDGPILRVTINRPEQGNGMSDAMALELAGLLDRAHESAELVLLRGAGADFCTGRARDPNAPPPSPEAYARRDEYDAIFNCYSAIRRCQVPVVGAVQGRAMGFGTAVIALCDVSFASDAATFNIPEMAHNIMPTMVMSALFDRMNRNAILWMTYSREFIDAQRALAYGLVSTVVPAARLDDEVESFCAKLAATPRPAVRGLKEYLRVAPGMSEQGAVDYARSLHAMVNTASAMKKTSGRS